MTPEEFLTALFGKGWTEDQLPLFLVMVQQMEQDAKRYHQVREALTGASFAADRKALYEIDNMVDSARTRGLI